MKNKRQKIIKTLSLLVVLYAIGLKTVPERMPFSNQEKNTDDFYAPHAGYCVPELEF